MAATKHEHVQQKVADPDVSIGRFRILRRTDGKLVVFEPGRAPGDGTVSGPHGSVEVAERAAHRLEAKRVEEASDERR